VCIIKGTFVGEKNFDVIKMHGTIIIIIILVVLHIQSTIQSEQANVVGTKQTSTANLA
jgi:hypothetical protein